MSTDSCPCGTGKTFDDCCGPLLAGTKKPATAEALMRSRYTAYTKADMDYVERTTAPEGRHDFDKEKARAWAVNSQWLGMEVHSTEAGGEADQTGVVDFTVRFTFQGVPGQQREVSRFRKEADGQWLYVDGAMGTAPIRREKIGRNDPCPCGSGKKYKQCCGR